jgi:hypothetical protein
MKSKFLYIEVQPGSLITWHTLGLTCKNMFLLLSLQKAVCSHTCTIMRLNTPFFGLLFDLLLFGCLCPYGNVSNQQATPFHYDSSSSLAPCCFLFVLDSRVMPMFQRGSPCEVQKLNLL